MECVIGECNFSSNLHTQRDLKELNTGYQSAHRTQLGHVPTQNWQSGVGPDGVGPDGVGPDGVGPDGVGEGGRRGLRIADTHLPREGRATAEHAGRARAGAGRD